MALPFFTIGHSTRSIPEFVALLSTAGVRLVADVRTVPRSPTNPQFNRYVLPDTPSNFQSAMNTLPRSVACAVIEATRLKA